MQVVSIRSQPPKGDLVSVEPQLVLMLQLQFQRGKRFPLDVAVQIRTEDKKLLGVARVLSLGKGGAVLEASDQTSQADGEMTQDVQVSLPLTRKQLDYVEDLREKHAKNDVVFDCSAEVVCLTSKTALSYLHVDEAQVANRGASPVLYNQNQSGRDPFVSRYGNMWLLSGSNGRAFLERETVQQRSTVTIPSSDWIHDYISSWTTTRHVVVELPQPQLLNASPTPDLQERVNAAIEAIKRASASADQGEWNDVVEDLRPVWELVRRHGEIRALLQRDAFTDEAIDALMSTIDQQFEFASKFVHRLDRGRRLQPEIVAHKEDAMACYSFAMSLLNLVTRKARRLG